MTIEEYREKINPCYGYDCWDEDMGCMMPSMDKCYACPLGTEKEDFYGD